MSELVEPSRLLRRAIERNLLEVESGAAGDLDLVRCRRARRRSGASPAAVLGLEDDDLLVSVDGVEAHETPWNLYLDPAAERVYRFVRRRDGQAMRVRATGVDLGVEWAPTLEGLVRRWDPLEGDPTALLDLWRFQAWEPLQGLAWMRCMRTRTAPGLLSRFRRLEDPDTPAAVLLGAALWEQGRFGPGTTHIADWLEAHEGEGPPDIAALAWYYVAREAHRTGQRLRAIRAARRALAEAWLEPAAALLAEWTGEVTASPRGRWETLEFPAHYALPPIDADPAQVDEVSFEAALSDMQPHQVLLVVVLGRQRGCATCDDLMFRYVNFATWMPEFFAGTHVIAARAQRERGPDHWVGEDLAREEGLPLQVLLDQYDRVTERLELPDTPVAYAVDARGTVLHEGLLASPELWDALALASLHGRAR